MTKQSSKKTRNLDAFDSLYREFIEGDPEQERLFQQEWISADIAQQIYDLRAKAELTQKELAKRVGTTPSVISRLESADYHGHSLSMLLRIGAALGKRVEVRFVQPERKAAQSA